MREQTRLKTLKDALTAKKRELCMRIAQRRNEIMVDGDPDDEAARAVDLAFRDFAAFNMEREIETLAQIECSLRRLGNGDYGTCATCDTEIPVARLEALPWTRVCVNCAESGARRGLSVMNPSNQRSFRLSF